jgi:hypothetical protein
MKYYHMEIKHTLLCHISRFIQLGCSAVQFETQLILNVVHYCIHRGPSVPLPNKIDATNEDFILPRNTLTGGGAGLGRSTT